MSLVSVTPVAGRIAEIRAALGRPTPSTSGFSQRLSAAQAADTGSAPAAVTVEQAARGPVVSAAAIATLTSGATVAAPGVVLTPTPGISGHNESHHDESVDAARPTQPTDIDSVPSANSLPLTVADSPYAQLFNDAGARHGVSPALLAAVAEVESGFDPVAVSSAGATGLMQFMPATAAEMGVDPLDPVSAIDGAARYLARDIERFGRLDHAIAAYNAGPGAVAEHGGIPPFTETQQYVRKVLTALEARR